MRFYSDAFQHGLRDDDADGIFPLVESSAYTQTRFRGRIANQLYCGFAAHERAAAPVLCDLSEEAMFDLDPLAGARREMADAHVEAGVVCEALEFHAPEVRTRTVAPSTIGRDQELFGPRIGLVPHLSPPTAERRNSEFCAVVIDPDTYPRFVAEGVVDTVTNDFAQAIVDEVMHADRFRMTLRVPFASAVLEVTHKLLLLRIDRNDGLTARHELLRRRVDVLGLRVPIGRLRAFARLAHDLQTVAKIVQKQAHFGRAHRMTHRLQFLREFCLALRRPTQRRLRVAACYGIDERLEVTHQRRIAFGQFGPTASRTPDALVSRRFNR